VRHSGPPCQGKREARTTRGRLDQGGRRPDHRTPEPEGGETDVRSESVPVREDAGKSRECDLKIDAVAEGTRGKIGDRHRVNVLLHKIAGEFSTETATKLSTPATAQPQSSRVFRGTLRTHRYECRETLQCSAIACPALVTGSGEWSNLGPTGGLREPKATRSGRSPPAANGCTRKLRELDEPVRQAPKSLYHHPATGNSRARLGRRRHSHGVKQIP